MTEEEETLFRQAARAALAEGQDVLMVASDDPEELPIFTVVRFEGQSAVAIVIPAAWETIDGMEDRCQGILRQEHKAMAGHRLD